MSFFTAPQKITVALLLVVLLGYALPMAAQVAPLEAGKCALLGIKCAGSGDTAATLGEYFWGVINVFLAVVAVIAFAFIIYGGIKYITSGGDEGGAEQGKKAVQYAVMGLVIIGIAAVIVNFTLKAIGMESVIPGGDDLPGVLLTIFNVFLTLLGVIAFVYVIIGGVKYVTSAGDEGQAEEGKKAVQYAVIGLVIVGLAAILVNFTFVAVGGEAPLEGGEDLPGTILLVVNAFLTLVGVIALIYVVIGGAKYITSSGAEDQAEEGKKTVQYAVMGLVLIGVAAVIVNFTFAAVGASPQLPGSSDLAGTIWLIANFFLMLVGVIALVFVVIGGVKYITSNGEEDKAEEGKRTILYALIGLIVIGLSAVIVNFVFSAFGNSFF